jgi:hypothetical protein
MSMRIVAIGLLLAMLITTYADAQVVDSPKDERRRTAESLSNLLGLPPGVLDVPSRYSGTIRYSMEMASGTIVSTDAEVEFTHDLASSAEHPDTFSYELTSAVVKIKWGSEAIMDKDPCTAISTSPNTLIVTLEDEEDVLWRMLGALVLVRHDNAGFQYRGDAAFETNSPGPFTVTWRCPDSPRDVIERGRPSVPLTFFLAGPPADITDDGPPRYTFRPVTGPEGPLALSGIYTNQRKVHDRTHHDNETIVTNTWQWDLRGEDEEQEGPEPVSVVIEGPSCGCVDEKGASGKLSYTARADKPGGTFTKFTVMPTGQSPTVVSNQGGAAPRVELAATKTTGSATLTITYTKDGKSYTAPEFPISFCAIDRVEFPGNVRDFSFNSAQPGRAEVKPRSRAWLNSKEVSQQLEWTLEAMDRPTRLDPEKATGASVTLGYEGLPYLNQALGEKTLTVRVNAGDCYCQRKEKVRVFFLPFATNHPLPKGADDPDKAGRPNWFYYWTMVSALEGLRPHVKYRNAVECLIVERDPDLMGSYLGGIDQRFVDNIHVCDAAASTATNPLTGAFYEGIDNVAITIVHEWLHREHHRIWWEPLQTKVGQTQFNIDVTRLDKDDDWVPDAAEPALGLDPNKKKSKDPGVVDNEYYAWTAEKAWVNGQVDAEDWSCGGRQWAGGNCPK